MKKLVLKLVVTAFVLAGVVGFNATKDSQNCDPGGGTRPPGDTMIIGL